MLKIAVTGHRPHKLKGGYNLDNPNNQALKSKLKELVLENKKDGEMLVGISGMALGVDTLFAELILDLREENPEEYSLECAIPCLYQERRWNKPDQEWYQTILKFADTVTQCSSETYKPYLMMRRNEYMIDNADIVIAVWDGKENGGTYQAVQYAKKKGKQIIQVSDFLK